MALLKRLAISLKYIQQYTNQFLKSQYSKLQHTRRNQCFCNLWLRFFYFWCTSRLFTGLFSEGFFLQVLFKPVLRVIHCWFSERTQFAFLNISVYFQMFYCLFKTNTATRPPVVFPTPTLLCWASVQYHFTGSSIYSCRKSEIFPKHFKI